MINRHATNAFTCYRVTLVARHIYGRRDICAAGGR